MRFAWVGSVGLPFNHPLIAGSKDRYRVSNRTSSSLRSFSVSMGFSLRLKVSPGTMRLFGREASTTDWYVDWDMMFFWRGIGFPILLPSFLYIYSTQNKEIVWTYFSDVAAFCWFATNPQFDESAALKPCFVPRLMNISPLSRNWVLNTASPPVPLQKPVQKSGKALVVGSEMLCNLRLNLQCGGLENPSCAFDRELEMPVDRVLNVPPYERSLGIYISTLLKEMDGVRSPTINC